MPWRTCWPMIVMLSGSPLNAAMCFLTHCSPATWSRTIMTTTSLKEAGDLVQHPIVARSLLGLRGQEAEHAQSVLEGHQHYVLGRQ